MENEISELVKMKLQKQIDDIYYNQAYQQRVLEIRELPKQRDRLADSQISVADRNAKMEQIKIIIHNNSNPLTEFNPYLFETLIDNYCPQSHGIHLRVSKRCGNAR